MKQYTVAIIGCGSIGALKDDTKDYPGGDAILTHAHAIDRHPQMKTVAFIDLDFRKVMQAADKWKSHAFCSIDNMVEHGTYSDIIIISVPTKYHHDTFRQILALRPRLVIAEKPFCSNLKEALEISNAYDVMKIPILVNYTRRFDPLTMGALIDIRDGIFGKVFHAHCYYGRGLKRDGCHALDLFGYVFGSPTGLEFDHLSKIDDGEDGDPTLTLRLQYENCQDVWMVGVDSRNYGLFEMEFVCEKGIIQFHDWGKYIRVFRPDIEKTFGQYNSLSRYGHRHEITRANIDSALLYVADNAVMSLEGVEQIRCASYDAIKVHRILEQVKETI